VGRLTAPGKGKKKTSRYLVKPGGPTTIFKGENKQIAAKKPASSLREEGEGRKQLKENTSRTEDPTRQIQIGGKREGKANPEEV